jgi:hypothetical protein
MNMVAAPINENQIVEALHALPPARWPEVLAYIDSLRVKENADDSMPVLTAADLAASPLVGLWADRTDFASSQEYARKLRDEAERREGLANAPGH